MIVGDLSILPWSFVALTDVLSDAALPGDYDQAFCAALIAMARFLADRLTSAHPELGREGAICPYLANAIERDAIYLRCSPATEAEVEDIVAEIADARRLLLELLASAPDDRDRKLLSLVVLFPNIETAAGYEAIATVQRRLKTFFVERNLMIGEFYPGCAAPGLHNARFAPFDAPVASLALRQMTLSDAPFLADDRRHVAAYLRRFGATGERRMALQAA